VYFGGTPLLQSSKTIATQKNITVNGVSMRIRNLQNNEPDSTTGYEISNFKNYHNMVQQHVHYNHTGDEHSSATLTWFGTFQFMRVGVYFRHDFRVIRFVRVPFDHEMTFGGRFLGGFAREMIVAVARTSGLFVLCA